MTITRETYLVELADGRTLECTPANPDKIRWEMTAARRWPEMLPDVAESGAVRIRGVYLQETFTVWACLTRTKQIETTFDDFRDAECLAIEEKEAATVDPTRPEPSASGSPTP